MVRTFRIDFCVDGAGSITGDSADIFSAEIFVCAAHDRGTSNK